MAARKKRKPATPKKRPAVHRSKKRPVRAPSATRTHPKSRKVTGSKSKLAKAAKLLGVSQTELRRILAKPEPKKRKKRKKPVAAIPPFARAAASLREFYAQREAPAPPVTRPPELPSLREQIAEARARLRQLETELQRVELPEVPEEPVEEAPEVPRPFDTPDELLDAVAASIATERHGVRNIELDDHGRVAGRDPTGRPVFAVVMMRRDGGKRSIRILWTGEEWAEPGAIEAEYGDEFNVNIYAAITRFDFEQEAAE